MAAGLRACDLVVGRRYISPSGRLCVLEASSQYGAHSDEYVFSYVSDQRDTFSISDGNLKAISAFKVAPFQPASYARAWRA